MVDHARFCKNCGAGLEEGAVGRKPQMPEVKKSYTLHIIAGYILALLFALLGLIMGIYLLTRRDSKKANRHGLYIVIIALIMMLWSFARFIF